MNAEELKTWALNMANTLGLEPADCKFELRLELSGSGNVIKNQVFATAWLSDPFECISRIGKTAQEAMTRCVKDATDAIAYREFRASREQKVADVKASIASGEYEADIDPKIDEAIEKLTDVVCNPPTEITGMVDNDVDGLGGDGFRMVQDDSEISGAIDAASGNVTSDADSGL